MELSEVLYAEPFQHAYLYNITFIILLIVVICIFLCVPKTSTYSFIGICVVAGVFFVFGITQIHYKQKWEHNYVKPYVEEQPLYETDNIYDIDLQTSNYTKIKFFHNDELIHQQATLQIVDDIDEPYITYNVVDKDISKHYKKGNVKNITLYIPHNTTTND